MEVEVEKIDIERYPEVNWLLGRTSDEKASVYFKEVLGIPLPDKNLVLDRMEKKYDEWLHLPLLVVEYVEKGVTRYRLLDGCHRFIVLVMCKERKKVKVQLCERVKKGGLG